MRIRTCVDNRQLGDKEVQIEDVRGAVSVNPVQEGIQVCTVRGIPSRKAQYATLSPEGVDKLIEELQRVKAERWPIT